MKPIVDHIQITVQDLDVAEAFYDKMLAIVGFDVDRKIRATVAEHEFDVVEYSHPNLTLGINSPRSAFADESVHRRRPGALHHLAFRAESRAEVDRAHRALQAMDADIVGGPKLWPQHGAEYYALFFKDPAGIKYEIVHES